jgi:hypothetical protein
LGTLASDVNPCRPEAVDPVFGNRIDNFTLREAFGIGLLCSPASIPWKKVWFLNAIFVSLYVLQVPVEKED